MLNLMIIDGYICDIPKIIQGDGEKAMIKFKLATFNPNKSSAQKYMWVDVVMFSTQKQIELVKNILNKDDFVTCTGAYSYQKIGKNYYSQLILKHIDKKFSKGNIPSEDILITDEELKW